jgi:environmental stress-induced protein Ves
MAITIKQFGDFERSTWSGGSTTQLLILPENGSYNERNFDLRISTATIEVEESEFTPLHDYVRKIMVLSGDLILEHQGEHTVLLKPFDQDQFFGDWHTKSKGMAVDFNVIYKPGIPVDLGHQHLEKEGYFTLHHSDEAYVYVFKGSGNVKGIEFSEGDLISIQNEVLVSFYATDNSDLVIVGLKK